MSEKNNFPLACVAPPLTEGLLAKYRLLVANVPPRTELRDALDSLLACVEAWWELPESPTSAKHTRLSLTHGGKAKEIALTPLAKDIAENLFDATPWMREIQAMTGYRDPASQAYVPGLFDALPGGDLRDAAYHLAWHCEQLTLDREPPTTDKLTA